MNKQSQAIDDLAARATALEQEQAAMREVLRIISRSPGDLDASLRAVADAALRLCHADTARVFLRDGAFLEVGPSARRDGAPLVIPEGERRIPLAGPIPFANHEAARTGRTVHYADYLRELEARGVSPAALAAYVDQVKQQPGYREVRTSLAVPLLRDGTTVGVLLLNQYEEVRPFSDREIALAEAFAEQAVIAIENARLFEEVQARNVELADGLEREQAIGDVLRIISRSPTDLQAVLEAVVANTVRLCEGEGGFLLDVQGGTLHILARHPDWVRGVDFPLTRGNVMGRAVIDRAVVHHFGDVDAYEREFPETAARRRQQPVDPEEPWAAMAAPLLRGGEAIGAIAISNFRHGARPFTDRQVALLETFADQAAIAIENARLFKEVQDRNREQAEALEREQATAGVLRVISRTPGNLDAALQAIADAAMQLCNADGSRVRLLDGAFMTFGPCAGLQSSIPPGTRRRIPDHVQADRQLLDAGHYVHIEDYQAHAEQFGYPAESLEDSRVTGLRTQLTVPMMAATARLGSLVLVRMGEVRPFSEREIALAESFADQAVIAIENARLFAELQDSNASLREALEQQTATSDILRAISNVPGNVTTVFETILESAQRLAGASIGSVFLYRDRLLHCAAGRGHSEARRRWLQTPLAPRPEGGGISLTIRELRTAVIADVREGVSPEVYAELYPDGEARSACTVPVLRAGELLGAISFIRTEVNPFTERQIALLETFADQAAIAIENARLFEELEKRNREQAEALEREQATTDVLRIISSTPGDLRSVFDQIAERVGRLCEADDAGIETYDGEFFRLPVALFVIHEGIGVASHGYPGPQGLARRPDPETAIGRAVLERRVVHLWGEPEEIETELPGAAEIFRAVGLRAVVVVPLLRNGEPVGAVFARRREPRPFTEQQIALLQTFADQAVIAIENARLFSELQEQLEQQTATSRILEVLSGSPAELQPVLDAVVESAAQLTGGEAAAIQRLVGDHLTVIASTIPEDQRAESRLIPFHQPFEPGPFSRRAMAERRSVHVAGEPDDLERDYPYVAVRWRETGTRSALWVPLVREGEPIGVLSVQRTQPIPFSDKQVALLETFADQAVIAIENTRLYSELQGSNATLREALEQQTATADILAVISRSPSDVQPVAQAIVDRAAALCGAEPVLLGLLDDGPTLHILARYSTLRPDLNVGRIVPIEPHTAVGEAMRARRLVHEHGTLDELFASARAGMTRRETLTAMRSFGWQRATILTIPLMRDTDVIGFLQLYRADGVPFSDGQIALLQTFADQAVIAIENARLFDEVQARTRELEERNRDLAEALEHRTATGEVLEVISRSPADLQEVLDSIAGRAARLMDGFSAYIFRLFSDELEAVSGFVDGQRPGARLGRPSIRGNVLGRASVVGLALRERQTVHRFGGADTIADELPLSVGPWRDRGIGSAVAVPLLTGSTLFGAVVVHRHTTAPFTPAQITLLETFADQAVIAIENARLFEELQTRTRELEAASQAQREFLSRMSHELRTPLNAIIGFAEIMEMDQATTLKQHERVQHILRGGRHLLGLINEVLDIARIEAGRLSLSLEPVALDAVLGEVLELMRPIAIDADVDLQVPDAPALHVAVQADRGRLRQIILNLVTNGVKYNHAGGSVTLTSVEGPDGLRRLTVSDTGPGITADEIDRLFAPFERLSADQSGVEGTGLGLAIAKRLAQAMGGDIGVESVVGQGSVFWLDLPAASLPLGLLSEPEDETRLTAANGAARAATVLYIEDNLPNVELVQHILGFRPGVTLLTAPRAEVGLRLAGRYLPDLILLDLNLPDLQGDEVLARLRADPRTAAIPVVMVSADATESQIQRLLAAGARDYLTKPLDVKRFLALIDEVGAGGTAAEGG